MQRPGWNATRRNRNIGTARQGHGQDNRMVIPSNWQDLRRYWKRLAADGLSPEDFVWEEGGGRGPGA